MSRNSKRNSIRLRKGAYDKLKADLSSSEDKCEQLRAENISIVKRLHLFDLKTKKFKGRRLGWKRRRKLDKTFILQRKRESELQRKSDINLIPVPA